MTNGVSRKTWLLLSGLLCVSFFAFSLARGGDTGFELRHCQVDKDDILSGGPGKDGIPALTYPAYIPAADAQFMQPADRVIGVVQNGEARAYPVAILTWHEVINDTLGDVPIAVTYCPLCDSSLVFHREVGGRRCPSRSWNWLKGVAVHPTRA